MLARLHGPYKVKRGGRKLKIAYVRDKDLNLMLEACSRCFLEGDRSLFRAQCQTESAAVPVAGEMKQSATVSTTGVQHVLAASQSQQFDAMIEHSDLRHGRRIMVQEKSMMNVVAPKGLIQERE